MAPSMSAYWKSRSPDKASKVRSKTPFSAHLRKRFHTVPHLPKQGGRLRHGAPDRTHSQHRLNELPVVPAGPAGVTVLAKQKRRDPFPLRVAQQISIQG